MLFSIFGKYVYRFLHDGSTERDEGKEVKQQDIKALERGLERGSQPVHGFSVYE